MTTIVAFQVVILAVALILFWKVRRAHIMMYELRDALPFQLANQFKQNEALLGLYRELDLRKSLPSTRGWAASPDFLLTISCQVLDTRPETIVECSSGVSTVVLARALQLNGKGHVFSLEHDPVFAQKTRDNLARMDLSDWATVIDAPLVEQNILGETWPWYSIEKLPASLSVNMLVIDGPPATTGKMARYPALPMLRSLLANRCTIFLDDADRSDEQAAVKQWLAQLEGFTLEERVCEKGCAMLVKSSV